MRIRGWYWLLICRGLYKDTLCIASNWRNPYFWKHATLICNPNITFNWNTVTRDILGVFLSSDLPWEHGTIFVAIATFLIRFRIPARLVCRGVSGFVISYPCVVWCSVCWSTTLQSYSKWLIYNFLIVAIYISLLFISYISKHIICVIWYSPLEEDLIDLSVLTLFPLKRAPCSF